MTIKEIMRGRLGRYGPLAVWIAVILIAGTSTGSMSNTSRIIRPLLVWLFPAAPEETLAVYHGYIRKCAHLTEYAILAFWAARAFWGSSRTVLAKYWYAAAVAVVLMTASLDEFNQSFNTMRTSSTFDVLIDCIGGAAMISILAIKRGKVMANG